MCLPFSPFQPRRGLLFVPHKAFGLAGHSEEASSWLKRGEGQTHKKRYSRTFVISSLFKLDVIRHERNMIKKSDGYCDSDTLCDNKGWREARDSRDFPQAHDGGSKKM